MNCPGLDITSLQLNWGGWDGGCVCCRSWKYLLIKAHFTQLQANQDDGEYDK